MCIRDRDYTVMAYITRCRIREAMKLLTNCRYKVYEVGEKMCIRDSSGIFQLSVVLLLQNRKRRNIYAYCAKSDSFFPGGMCIRDSCHTGLRHRNLQFLHHGPE